MSSQLIVLLIVVVVAALIAAWLYSQRRQSERLQKRFGPEYERTLREQGDQRRAESALEARQQRVEQLHIRPLAPEDRTRLAEAWRQVQARFVDAPEGAVGEADRLVNEVMQRRGYPMGEFEQRAADVSVDHPRVVENYRAAHTLALRQERGEANTEDLRQAMVHYRALFDELLEARQGEPQEVQRG